MIYNKPAISTQKQIQLLKDRGLEFNNDKDAFHFLSNVSYYRLRAYTYPFQDNSDSNHSFINKVSFQDIIGNGMNNLNN